MPPPGPTPLKLHQPQKREFSEDDVTVVGRTEDLFAMLAREDDDGTSGLEDLANSDVDQLLSSIPAGPFVADSNPPTAPPVSRLPDLPPAPRMPPVPRPAAIPRVGLEVTAKPPAVNPAGPPARQPFPPAVSPKAPQAAPGARQPLSQFQPPQGAPPPDDEERTRVLTHQEAMKEVVPFDSEVLPDPFLEPAVASPARRSGMPTLHQVDDQNNKPTISAPQPSTPLEMPSDTEAPESAQCAGPRRRLRSVRRIAGAATQRRSHRPARGSQTQ